MYVSEALEHVEIMNKTLLKLEENPNIHEYLNLIFRSAHTLKGMAATMGYEQTKELCRNIENVFDDIRKTQTKLTSKLANVLFKCIDVLHQMVNDENKKVDLESYLYLLENPESSKKIENTELESVVQLPTIRVKMSDLDLLVNLVGELIISKMKLEKNVSDEGSAKTQQTLMELGRLVTDLQYQSTKLRLVPIETIFQRFSRVVRDTSSELGKKVKLHMEGAKIELDRTVLEAITDPLLHILRNCLDHGLETPSERKAVGKLEIGNIRLTAYHTGEQISIKIEDDGRGIDVEKIRAKAVEKGFITQEDASQMSEDAAINLLGTPGLSTAEEITDISGRGVGMDVVINRIKDVGGNVLITTKKGQGTTMILTIPLSVFIIGGLLVNVSNEKYILPISSITTTIKVDRNQIKSIHGIEIIEFQDKIVPLVKVAKILGIKSKNDNKDENAVTIIIVDKGGKPYGLVVDSFERKQEIVIKKFTNTSDSTVAFTNATILSDGTVALILEPSILV